MPFRNKFFHERLLFGKQLLALRNMTALHSSFIFARPIVHFALLLLCSATIAAFTASADDRIPPKCRITKNRRLSPLNGRRPRNEKRRPRENRGLQIWTLSAGLRPMTSPIGLAPETSPTASAKSPCSNSCSALSSAPPSVGAACAFTEFDLRQLATVRKGLDDRCRASITLGDPNPVFPANPRLRLFSSK